MATRDYRILLPPDTAVVAACEQAACESWRYGWDVLLDESTAGGADAAAWIRSGLSGRTFRELPGTADGGMAVFRFDARQRCFAGHATRPAVWLAGGRRVAGMLEWLDDLDEHAGRLAGQAQRG